MISGIEVQCICVRSVGVGLRLMSLPERKAGLTCVTNALKKTRRGDAVLFNIKLNWKGDGYSYYRHAKNKRHALILAVRAFEKEIGREAGTLIAYFIGSEVYDYTDRYRIKE